MTYLINLLILAVITYRIFIGITEGLFNELINLVNFLFSAAISFILFRWLGPYVYKYIFPNEEYALLIAFWASFVMFISILWSIKQLFFAKIYSMTKEKTINFLALIDKTGGAICGVLLGLNLMSCIIISLYIAPATKDLYNPDEKDKIIFKTVEFRLKTYNDWKEFLNTQKPKGNPVEENKKQEEVSATEKEKSQE